MSESQAPTISRVIDRIPVSSFHRHLLAICGSAWAFDGMEVIIISFTLPILIDVWSLSGLMAGFLGSASLIGMILGNWFWGWFADEKGRKNALQWTILSYSVFAGLTALATDFYSAFFLRLLTGVGLGGALAVDTSYLSEHLPTNRRGSFLVYLDAFWPIGYFIAVVLAWIFLSAIITSSGQVIIPYLGSIAGWRLLFLASAFPAAIVYIIRKRLEETPYFLAKQGKIEKANKRLERMAKEAGEEHRPISIEDIDIPSRPSFTRLFNRDILQQTLMIGAAWFALNFGYYGVFIWLPKTVGAAGLVGNIYLYFVLIALVQIPGYLSAAYLVEKIGRKKTLSSYLILSGVFTFLFSAAMPNVAILGISFGGFWQFLAGLLGASFFALGAWGSIYAYTPELFPTEARGTGMGYAGGVGKIAAVIGPIVAGSIVETSYLAALTPLALAFAAGGIIVLIFGKETRGKPLL